MRNDYDLIEKHARMIAETKTEAETDRERESKKDAIVAIS